jgi:ABC-type transport system involved in multi-copper enzyme maturation permease subunit
MTATITRDRPGQQAEQDGFGRLLRAEWTKFRTVRGWVIGMAVAAVLMDLVGLFAAGNSSHSGGCPSSPGHGGASCVPAIPLGPDGEAVTDSFYFVRQPLAGDGSITARMTSLTGEYGGGAGPASPGGPLSNMHRGVQPWSKAGIIIKASTKQGSAYAAMLVTGRHGVRMQYNYTRDVAGLPGAVSPRWLRLTRSGDTITGYDSADGTHWTQVGAVRLAGLSSTVQAGLFATSPAYVQLSQFFGGTTGQVGPSLATGVFDHVSLTGGRVKGDGEVGGAWTGDNIGDQGAYGPQTSQVEGFRRAVGTFTGTGSGDIAPVGAGPASSGPASPGPDATIEGHLLGAFAGLIAVIVIAAMFMTAEYRRGLIRTTLAAAPRRGQVLAAKAIVIGLVTFVVGMVAAVIAVVVGTRLSRDQGSYVLPVPWLTEVRVIAGTAALLAVGAVLALALGTILRRSAAAVTAAIVAIVLPYVLGVASVLPVAAAEWLLRVTPAAAFAMQQSIPAYPQVTDVYTPPAYFPLAPWAGFAVLCGYAALALGLASFLLRRRDA